MVVKATRFDSVIERCRLGLRLRYLRGIANQADPLMEAEINLIRKLGFEEALIKIVEFGDHLRRRNVAFHLIGSGGSSIIFFILGMSEVDPIRYDTHFERLWLTASTPSIFE